MYEPMKGKQFKGSTVEMALVFLKINNVVLVV